MNKEAETDIVFLSLILNLQGAALQQMGKMGNPFTGKIERNLEAAKQSIDLLDCLERKTQGNLSADEEKTFQEVLTYLRLNYVDELKKGTEDEEPVAGEDLDTETSTESGNEDAATAGD